jgi:hypothetical protein
MSRHPSHCVAALALTLSLLVDAAQAQTIERAKLTDGDMTCAQVYSEVKMMEMVAASVAPPPAAAPVLVAAAPQADAAAAAAGGQVLNALAQQAGARSGLGGLFSGLVGGGAAPQQVAQAQNAQQQAMALAAQLASQQAGQTQAGNAQATAAQINALQALAQNRGVGNGNAAGVASLLGGLFGAAQAATNAAPAAAPVAAVAAVPAGNAALAQQAGARKDHLTGLFLAKGCKLSDVQR